MKTSVLLFLDLDGVLHGYGDVKNLFGLKHELERHLQKWDDKLDIKIVFVSDWQFSFDLDALKEEVAKDNEAFKARIIDGTHYHLPESFNKLLYNVRLSRLVQIKYYLHKFNIAPEQVIIIDDDMAAYPELMLFAPALPNQWQNNEDVLATYDYALSQVVDRKEYAYLFDNTQDMKFFNRFIKTESFLGLAEKDFQLLDILLQRFVNAL